MTKLKLPLTLVLWVEKSMYGKKYMGISRSTFVLDEQCYYTYF
jgi:peroxiredoxin